MYFYILEVKPTLPQLPRRGTQPRPPKANTITIAAPKTLLLKRVPKW